MAGRAVRVDVRMMIAAWPVDSPRGAVSAFCRQHGISRSRFYEIRALSARHGALEAVAPLVPARQRPDLAIPAAVEAAAARIRKELSEAGWDAGPISVRAAMRAQGIPAPSRATLARVFTRAGMVTPQPQKRPRSSWRRFTFAEVHECWQLDATEWRLTDGSSVVVFQLLDDHSRLIVGSWVAAAETSDAAVAVFTAAVAAHQAPVLLLTDNGMALNPHRRGKTSDLVLAARAVGTKPITSSAYHPQTVGKNERVHATLKRWLRARPAPVSIAELTTWLADFDEHYNHHRPHQGLQGRTPAQALAQDRWAVPPQPPQPPQPAARPSPWRGRSTEPRVIRVHPNGSAQVGRYYIGLGVEHAGSEVLAVVEDAVISLFDHRGTHLRTVTTVPDIRYYGTGRTKGGHRRRRLGATINRTTKLSGPTETSTSGPN